MDRRGTASDAGGSNGAPPPPAAPGTGNGRANGARQQAAKAPPAGGHMPGELRPEDIRVGGKDQSDRDVAWVYWSTKDYAIYQWSKEAPAETFWQRWTTRRECGISPHFGHPEQRIAYAQIGCDLSRIHALQHGRLARRESVNREIARAVALALEGHRDEAKAILAHLKARLVNMRNIEGRASYLGACMSAMLFFLAVLVVAVQADPANRFVGVFGNDLMLLKVATCGALGAFLSVCLRIKQLEIDPETPRKVNRVSGITRLVIGIAAGIVVYLAIGSGLVLSALGQGGQEAKEAATAGVLLLAVVAGFSEGFVPNILLKVGGEGNGADKAGDPTPTAPRGGGAAGRLRHGCGEATGPGLCAACRGRGRLRRRGAAP